MNVAGIWDNLSEPTRARVMDKLGLPSHMEAVMKTFAQLDPAVQAKVKELAEQTGGRLHTFQAEQPIRPAPIMQGAPVPQRVLVEKIIDFVRDNTGVYTQRGIVDSIAQRMGVSPNEVETAFHQASRRGEISEGDRQRVVYGPGYD